MNLISIIASYLECLKSRVLVIPLYTFPALVNLLIASRLMIQPIQIGLLAVGITLVSYSVYWYNDYRDTEEEQKTGVFEDISHSQRPLAMGTVSRRVFLVYLIVTAAMGLVLSYLINPIVFTLQLAFLILGYLYSTEPFRIKKRFVGKPLTFIAGVLISAICGALVYGAISIQNVYSFIVLAILYATGPSLGDIRDITGDRKMGVKTIPIVLGPENTVRLAIAGFVAVMLAGLVGYIDMGFNVSLPILTMIIMITWIYSTYPLLNKWRDPVYVDKIAYKRLVPMNMLVQLLPLIGLLTL